MPSDQIKKYGTVLIVSGPSGAGKTTVYQRLRHKLPSLKFSISCTTRAPRPGEVHNVDYHFLTREEFEHHIGIGAFLEYAEVHGNFYGTLKQGVEETVRASENILLDIDVQGVHQMRQAMKGSELENCFVYVFIGPPSLAELERRLRKRGTDSEEVILRRLGNSTGELAAWREYDYLVINDDFKDAARELEVILEASQLATTRFAPDCPFPRKDWMP
jgi:guanylate kinase